MKDIRESKISADGLRYRGDMRKAGEIPAFLYEKYS